MIEHRLYIRECFRLAKLAIGSTSPNPYVGAVIVKENIIIGRGFHKKSGADHAEIDAIKNTNEDLTGSTLYCNLEPCCHTNKKTPPCAQYILKTGISKVVISNLDPNPEVAGSGVELLRAAGIEVIINILQKEGALLNEVFFTHIIRKKPFIHLKWAQTLDGKIATHNFDSKWITNEQSRKNSHQERNLYDAVVVGANTLNQDNPSLTIRLNDNIKSKKRIIISKSGEIDLKSKLLTDQFKEQTIIVTSNTSNDYPVHTILIQESDFSLPNILNKLYDFGIYSIYVEGGGDLLNSFIKEKLYDRISIFIAPKILGKGISILDAKVDSITDAFSFENPNWIHFGSDIKLETSENICLQA